MRGLLKKEGLWKVLLVFPLLIGCMVGPDYKRPVTVAQQTNGFVNAAGPVDDGSDWPPVSPWWKTFGDPVIAELVEVALDGNTDLKAAAASVLEAKYLLEASHGAQLPDITYSGSGSRIKTAFDLGSQRLNFFNTNYQHGLSVSWMGDFFGKLKRAERAAMADLLAAESDRQALEHSLISQVILTRIQIATQHNLLTIADNTVRNWQQSLEVLDRRYRQGLTGSLDVYLARENLEAAKATRQSIVQSLKLAGHSLDVLVAIPPGRSEDLPATLTALPVLDAVPEGLPVRLLDRRPDIRAAEATLAAATERVGVSIAQLYPDVTLTGTYGFNSTAFKSVFDDKNEVYSAILSLSAPIWRGGQLRANVKASQARVERAASVYAGVIFKAMREVEDALVKQQTLSERITHLTARLQHARNAEALSRKRYLEGVEKIITVLETERRRRLAENELAVAQGALWQSRVELMLALGGDWGTINKDK